MFCAYFGFNILIAWVGDGPWKDRLSPTCHRDSLPMASDQGIGLQAHLRLKCYPLRFVFVFCDWWKDQKNLIFYKARTEYAQLFLKIKLELFTCVMLLWIGNIGIPLLTFPTTFLFTKKKCTLIVHANMELW